MRVDPALLDRVLVLRTRHQLTRVQIAARIGRSERRVQAYLVELRRQGRLEGAVRYGTHSGEAA